MVPEKTVHGSISQSPENWRRAGPPHHPVVHGGLPSGPRQITQRFTSKLSHKNNLRRRQLWQVTKKMTKKMRQGLKRPRNLPWPPKSPPRQPPLESNDHHSPALRWSLLLHIMELRKHRFGGIWGLQPCRLKGLPDKTSVANSHAEVESQGHSHAMGETHAQGGGQTHTQGGGQTHGGENPFGGGQAHGGGQVLGGGEIPVGGPQQMALMFEMIKGMQQNQVELAESLRQLREANGNKEDHQNKNDNRNHEERESHNKNDTPSHTPEKYDTPVFALFDGRKGSAMEHIRHTLGTQCCLLDPSEHGKTWWKASAANISMLKRKITLGQLAQHQAADRGRPGEVHPPLPGRVLGLSCEVSRGRASGDQVIKLPKISKQPTAEEQKDPKYCRYHRYVNHPTVDCRTLRWEVNRKIQEWQKSLPQQAASLVPAAVRTLQKSPKVQVTYSTSWDSDLRQEMQQLKRLLRIAAESGATCFTAEAHASRAFLETTNAITFTDEDMEVQYPDHRRPLYLSAVVKDVQVRRALVDTGSCLNLIPLSTLQAANVPQQKIQGSPMEVTGFGGMTEHTMGHVQLVLKVGPIVALTRFHVVNAETPYHVLLGRPWLHKHKLGVIHLPSMCQGETQWQTNPHSCKFLAPSTRLKLILLKQALYDDLASTGEPSIEGNVKLNLGVHHNACVSNSPMDALSIAYEENSGKVVVDQLQSTAMSSEEVTVDHAQSTTESMAINSERPAVDQTESTAMNSKEAAEDQTEYRPGDHDVFAWDYHEMPGIDPGLVAHSLNVEPGTRPVVQPMRTFHTEVEAQITQEDEFPLPNMDLLIDSAAGHAMFSFMDGFSGYNQIRMSTRDAEKTAFRTPIGNFYYTVMPFGLKNAGATYQRTMTAMFHDMMHKEIEDYVDDIVVKSKKREDHLRILRKVFDRCRLYKLKMNPLKCAFGVSAGKFLGFLVHNRGIDVDPAKASAIATMKAPTSHKELKSFLGRLSYIRRFIPGLAAVTAVFTPLMKKGVPFVWSTACQQAFEKIQLIMTKLPTVCAPVPGRPLRLYLASNSEAIGGLVAQEDEDGTEKPIYYNMKPTSPGWSIAHEMGIKHLRVIGDSNLIICQTKGEFSLKEPSLALYRALAQKLEEKFDTFEISHAMRCENRYADALATLGSQVSFEGSKVDVTIDKRSMPITDLLREKFKEQNLDAEDWRIPIKAKLMSPEGVADLKVLKDYVLIAGDLYRRLPGGVLARCVNLQEAAKKLIEVHEKCCELQRWGKPLPQTPAPGSTQHLSSSDWRTPFLEYLIENILPQTSQAAIRIKKLATRYFVEGGILFRKGFHGDPLRCLSLAESQTVMKEAHSGECGEHQGKKRLYQLLLTLGYYWPTMKKDTADFVKSCHTCQLQANLIHTHPTSLQNMATPWPFHTWGLDLIGPINPSSGGYIWILVATEYFSKWVEAIPLRKATGAAVANFIREHIITSTADPHPIILKEMDKRRLTNRMLLRILSKMVFDYGKGWSSHLADTLWAYRGSTKIATGFTPFSLVYGTDAISPTELLVPSPRILHGMDLEADADICAEARVADLESLGRSKRAGSSP
uniref:Uncharacterized protein n=1 Tax=Fagus sylvatica TaxID=28930 RepID=A0A2N9G962_FAGSY